jgi:excisionase family DNA binding protein
MSSSLGEAVMTAGGEYLRAADIARLTGMSLRTVRRLIAEEIIPSIKLGGARLVAKAELGRLLSSLSTTAGRHD